MNQDYSNIYNYYEALVKTAFASHKYATTYVKYQDKQQQQQKHQAKVVVHNNKNDVEFEISDDFLEFYRESLKYKKEKKNEEKLKLKRILEGKIVDYVEGEQVKAYIKPQSKYAPNENYSLKRERELKQFYGDENYKRIQILETQLQMEYDQNMDRYQPIYWPSLPLKL